MKRYIEIVYDNSGSMNSYMGNEKRYEVAQKLFDKEILPTIAKSGDEVLLRLLRRDCDIESKSESLTSQFKTRAEMLERIKQIYHGQGTPLFYTMLDAIEACKKVMADEYLIFVLTDGDDTCGGNFKDIIPQDIFKKYFRIPPELLLVQFDIESKISRNNLTAFTSYIGGRTISIDKSDGIGGMRTKLKKALKVSGFSNKLPLEHCYDSQPGFDMNWEEAEELGFKFHNAQLLFQKNIIDWEPNPDIHVSRLQLAEFDFLDGIFFKTALPEEFTKAMLKQLKKPYYYSHDCIFWDFQSARWKYFKEQNQFEQVDNPDAKYDDEEDNIEELRRVQPVLLNDQVYLVSAEYYLNAPKQVKLIPKNRIPNVIKTIRCEEFIKFEI
jgi:hypothetical protein